MNPSLRSRCGIACAVAAALSLFATAAPGEPPAALANDAEARAHASFSRFADEWMAKVQRSVAEAKANPTVRPGASAPMITYRSYGDDYSVELRPTGHANAPYVGILRYREQLHSCSDANATECSVTSTVPVTEIFRYQNGRWDY